MKIKDNNNKEYVIQENSLMQKILNIRQILMNSLLDHEDQIVQQNLIYLYQSSLRSCLIINNLLKLNKYKDIFHFTLKQINFNFFEQIGINSIKHYEQTLSTIKEDQNQYKMLRVMFSYYSSLEQSSINHTIFESMLRKIY